MNLLIKNVNRNLDRSDSLMDFFDPSNNPTIEMFFINEFFFFWLASMIAVLRHYGNLAV